MPIIIQQEGSPFGYAGQGLAAAQQYRAGEQELDLRAEKAQREAQAFDLEKFATLEKLRQSQEALDFEKSQVAGSREAMAEYLIGEHQRLGLPVPNVPGGLQEFYAAMPERFQFDAVRDMRRFQLEREAERELVSTLRGAEADGFDDIAEAVETGQITPAQAKREMMRRNSEAAAVASKTNEKVRYAELATTFEADSLFEMPTDPSMAAEAHRLYAKLVVSQDVDPDGEYARDYWNWFSLVNRPLREALMADLEAQGIDPSARIVDEEIEARFTPNRAAAAVDATTHSPTRGARKKAEGATGNGAAKPADKSKEAPSILQPEAPTTEESGAMRNPAEVAVENALERMGLTEMPPVGSPTYKLLEMMVDRIQAEEQAQHDLMMGAQADADKAAAKAKGKKKEK